MTDETEPIVEMSFNEFVEGMEEAYEHQAMLENIEESFKKDFNGSRRVYADKVSRSEVLRNRVKAYHAQHNGHGR